MPQYMFRKCLIQLQRSNFFIDCIIYADFFIQLAKKKKKNTSILVKLCYYKTQIKKHTQSYIFSTLKYDNTLTCLYLITRK